jgi:DNA-binding NarL/FixJ family response regulator
VADHTSPKGHARAERNVAALPEPLLVLPCVSSSMRSNYFAAIEGARQIHLLPVALISTLAFRAQSDQPDVIVIVTEDFISPAGQTSLLRETLYGIPAILLVAEVNDGVKKRAARFGIHSVLPMNVNADQLLAAIAGTAAGLIVALEPFTDAHDEPMHSSELADEESSHLAIVEHLTSRETDVLRLMALGRGNKQIAAALDISEHTAKFHVSSVLAKLGARSRTEAVTIGITQGLVAI